MDLASDLQPGERITLVTRHHILVCTVQSVRAHASEEVDPTDPSEEQDAQASLQIPVTVDLSRQRLDG